MRARVLPALLLASALWLTLAPYSYATAPCTGEVPDACGYLPSTYTELGFTGGMPALCAGECTLSGGFDRCGVCGGAAEYSQRLLMPLAVSDSARMGGSVANWNGSVALSQHIAQAHAPLVDVPVVTWTLDHATQMYEYYELPSATADSAAAADRVPVGAGFGLIMSEHFLVVGAHDSHPRGVQLWTRTQSPPWSYTWTAADPCPGNRFGFSVGVDERLPIAADDDDDGLRGSVVAGDPGAFFSGRVYVYFTYSPGILQSLHYGTGNETERACFGHSVSADSGYLAVGAPALDYGGETNAGTVFLYQWNASAALQGEYEFRAQIAPPTPQHNGGFGQSVSVWDSWLMVGDNQHSVYMYKLAGAVVVPIATDLPSGTNLVSRLGYTVSLWDRLAVAGDEEYVVSPSAKGASFVWGDNPLLATGYRPEYRLHDELASFNTRYGAAVDVRGGCYVASGAPNEPAQGGVYVTDLCRSDCYGCDGVFNSCTIVDECGVCGGDGSLCMDCFGVFNGDAVEDACQVCDGDNSTCIIAYSEPASIVISCAGELTVTLRHQFEEQHGPATFVVVAPLPSKGVAVVADSGSLVPLPTLTYDDLPFQDGADSISVLATVLSTGANDTIVIPVTIGTCIDCFGVVDGPARLDECGVCDGGDLTCVDCDGVPNGGLVFDYCTVCGGDNTTCLEITTDPMHEVDCTAQIVFALHHQPAGIPVRWEIIQGPFVGEAFVNLLSGFVVYENPAHMGHDWFVVRVTSILDASVVATQNITFLIDACVDCAGDQNGFQIVDLCGVCGGDSSSCVDCAGTPLGTSVVDACGVCGGDSLECIGCDGVVNSGVVVDACGVCGGNNDSCGPGAGPSFAIVVVLAGIALFTTLLYAVMHLYRMWTQRRRISSITAQPTAQDVNIVEVHRPSQLPPLGANRRRGGYSPQQAIDNSSQSAGDYIVTESPVFYSNS